MESALALAQSLIDGGPSGSAIATAAYQRLPAKYGAEIEFTVTAKSNLEQIQAPGAPR